MTDPNPNPNPAPAPAPAPDVWHKGLSGVDDAMIGYWQNRGWATKTPQEIAVEASKAHREAERYIGAPANELLRIPKADAPEADRNTFYQRLGAPADKNEYVEGIKGVKFADGTELDQAFIDFARDTAASLHLPKASAAQFTQALVKHFDGLEAADRADREGKLAAEKMELNKNWGANAPAFKLVAQRAAAALGVDPEAVSALESVIGYSKVMDMFQKIGSKIGEDAFLRSPGGGPTSGGLMSREQATARINELKADRAWVTRYTEGGATERRELEGLQRISLGIAA